MVGRITGLWVCVCGWLMGGWMDGRGWVDRCVDWMGWTDRLGGLMDGRVDLMNWMD